MYMTRKKKSKEKQEKDWVIVDAGEEVVLVVQGMPESSSLREDTKVCEGALPSSNERPCESRGDEGQVEGEVFKTKGKKE